MKKGQENQGGSGSKAPPPNAENGNEFNELYNEAKL